MEPVGCSTEGIFRISASQDAISVLRSKLESSQYEQLVQDTRDPHVAACVLKMWLMELAEPLITAEV